MDMALRDLEQIREREDGGAGRRLGLGVLGVLAGGGLVFALSATGGSRGAEAAPPDPLARLPGPAAGAVAARGDEAAPSALRREELTYPSALVDEETRPEVEQALAAAAAERAHPDPILTPDPLERAPAPTEAVPAALPAVVAAGATSRVFARPSADALVAAIPARAERPRAAVRAGHEGAYTVQVISFDTPTEADAFADALRARGHHAFVVTADVPGRGRHFRVRIGPFETLPEAEHYRRDFEQQERMATLLVRRPGEMRAAAE